MSDGDALPFKVPPMGDMLLALLSLCMCVVLQAWVKEHLKADEVVDYRSQDFALLYADKPFDIIIDLLANDAERTKKLRGVLKPDGHYCHMQNPGTDFDQLKKLEEVCDAWLQGHQPWFCPSCCDCTRCSGCAFVQASFPSVLN